MLSYPSGMTVSNRALIMLADLLRAHRAQLRTRWRRLDAGQQALLTVAHLRKGETYADLACGFRIGTSTVYRYLREALELLARRAGISTKTLYRLFPGKAAGHFNFRIRRSGRSSSSARSAVT